MEHRTFPVKSSILLTALLAALAAFFLMPIIATAAGSTADQAAYNEAAMQAKISLTSDGIVATPISLEPGNHLLTITNNTSVPRGVEMVGIDKASSPTVRYTSILQPGQSEDFRWYFATGKTVYVRDITSCTHGQMSCMAVDFGAMTKSIDVGFQPMEASR
jgi:hypothetical protein